MSFNTRTTRANSKQTTVLENTNLRSRKAAFGAKRTALGPSKRSALGDLSNASKGASSKIGTKKAVASSRTALTSRTSRINNASKLVAPKSRKLAPVVPQASDQMALDDDEVLAIDLSDKHDYEDIDEYDEDDAQSCVEYINEIFAYLRLKERKERVPANYMSRQHDLTPKMRSVLVDWMVDVHLKFKLLSETMFLSVNIIDRFLVLEQVNRHNLQLVGITAMLIASKYEEIYSPEVGDFVYICDNAYKKSEILRLEIQMLNSLNYSLTPATPLHFLRRFSKAARSDSTTHTLSKFIIELTLPVYEMLHYKPSTIASSAVYLARAMRGLKPYWNNTLVHYTQHTVQDLQRCAEHINHVLHDKSNSSLKATRRKYSSPTLLSTARISPVPTSTLF